MSSRYRDLDSVWDDRGFNAYSSFTQHPWRWILGFIAAICLLVFVLWEVGWIFNNANANREAHLIRNGYSNQQTLRDQITQNIGTVLMVSTQLTEASGKAQKQALFNQRLAILNIVCHDADQVTGDPLPSDQVQFVQTNCESGVVKPGSPYTKG